MSDDLSDDLKEQRHQIRFHADDNTFIAVKVDGHPTLGGVCVNESLNGCSGVFTTHDFFQIGNKCHIRVGKLETMEAEIRWVKNLDEEVVKVGFHYLE